MKKIIEIYSCFWNIIKNKSAPKFISRSVIWRENKIQTWTFDNFNHWVIKLLQTRLQPATRYQSYQCWLECVQMSKSIINTCRPSQKNTKAKFSDPYDLPFENWLYPQNNSIFEISRKSRFWGIFNRENG